MQALGASGSGDVPEATRRAIAEYPLEAAGRAPGGHNNPGYNDDGPCVATIARRLEAEPADDRLLVVLSDGRPAGLHSDEDDLRREVEAIRVRGRLDLVGIGCGPSTHGMSDYYPAAETGLDPEEIPGALARLLGAFARKTTASSCRNDGARGKPSPERKLI